MFQKKQRDGSCKMAKMIEEFNVVEKAAIRTMEKDILKAKAKEKKTLKFQVIPPEKTRKRRRKFLKQFWLKAKRSWKEWKVKRKEKTPVLKRELKKQPLAKKKVKEKIEKKAEIETERKILPRIGKIVEDEEEILKRKMLQELEREKIRLRNLTKALAVKRKTMEEMKKIVLKKLGPINKVLEEIKEKENQLKEEKKRIEKEEWSAITPKERRKLEKKRWKVEEKLEAITRERWRWEEKKLKELERLEKTYHSILEGEARVEAKKKEIAMREKEIKMREKRQELKRALQTLEEKKQPLRARKAILLEKLLRLQKNLHELKEREQSIEKTIQELEAKVEKVEIFEEKKLLEKKIWAAEDERKAIEEERWQLDEEEIELKKEIRKIDKECRVITAEEEKIKEKLKEVEIALGILPFPVPEEFLKLEKKILKEKPPTKLPAPPLIKPKPKKEEKLPAKSLITPSIRKPSIPSLKPKEIKKIPEELKKPEKEEKKLEEIKMRWQERAEERKKRKEILEKLRKIKVPKKEEEKLEKPKAEKKEIIEKKKVPELPPSVSLKERRLEEERLKREKIKRARIEELKKRLKKIQEEEEKKRRVFLERIEKEKEKILPKFPSLSKIKEEEMPEEVIIRTLPPKPSSMGKLFVRILVIIFLFAILGGIGGFWYWLLVKKPQTPPPVSKPPEEEIFQPIKPPLLPLSLIPIDETEVLEITHPEELVFSLTKSLQKESIETKFIRILFLDKQKNKYYNLEELLGRKEDFLSLALQVPEGFYEKLDKENYTFFHHFLAEPKKAKQHNVGLVVKIQEKSGIFDFLKNWETTMEKDTETLFYLLGKKEPAVRTYFKPFEYQETIIRCLPFELKKDFGICWTIKDDYFIFTSSGETIKEVLDRL